MPINKKNQRFRFVYLQKPNVNEGIMSEHRSLNNDNPKISVLLEEHFYIRNYKILKEQMEPDEIVDYLVQYKILDTEEDRYLLHICRTMKCDFILGRFIRDSRCREVLVGIHNSNELEGIHSFCSSLCYCDLELEEQNDRQGKTNQYNCYCQ